MLQEKKNIKIDDAFVYRLQNGRVVKPFIASGKLVIMDYVTSEMQPADPMGFYTKLNAGEIEELELTKDCAALYCNQRAAADQTFCPRCEKYLKDDGVPF